MPKVIVLGGGVAGLSAAHELLNRGFDVEVYERNPIHVGGKARSIDHNYEHQYNKPLPGEHGFRFFPGFYKHITATMKEIPYPEPDSSQSVFENLTPTSRILVARYGKKPIKLPASFPKSLKDLKLIFHTLYGLDLGLTDEEQKFFAERVWQLISSCYARRDNEYERLSWWQFTQAERFSKAYQHLLVEGLTRTLVAAKAELASTRTGGDIFLQLLLCMIDPAVDTDRVLDGPTNDRWLTAWKEYLLSKGMKLTQGASAMQVNMTGDNVQSVTINQQGELFEVTGDYYLMALPVEKAALLINKDMIDIDARLSFIQQLALSVAWMNGIQYYLTENVKLNQGHILCSDTEWALTCISQVQFWKDYDITTKGDGNVKGVLSVIISDWISPGKFTTSKSAQECTRAEVAEEVWAQLQASLNAGQERLRDDIVVDYYVDLDIRDKPPSQFESHELMDIEPLFINSVNTWGLRPDADCYIPNLFFAGDYVRTFTDLATMEGANESARRAVNCILEKEDSDKARCDIWNLREPFCFAPARWWDNWRYRQGLPWSIKLPFPIVVLTVLLAAVTLIKRIFVRQRLV